MFNRLSIAVLMMLLILMAGCMKSSRVSRADLENFLADTNLSGGNLLSILESDGFTSVNENGETSDQIAIVLNTRPTSNVKITLKPATTDIKLNNASAGSPVNIVFKKRNWDTPQIVKVTAVDDSVIAQGVKSIAVTLSAKTADPFYSSIDYSDFDIDVEVIDASNRYFGDFVVYGFWGTDPFIMEKVSHLHIGYNSFDADGNISSAASGWIDKVDYCHRYGVKAIIGFDVGNSWGPMMDNADGSRTNFVSNLVQLLIDSGADGTDFDHEHGPFGADYNALIVDCANAFAPYNFTVGADVYKYRYELASPGGLDYIDHLNLMAYDGADHLEDMISHWKGEGASDDTIMCGMADGWSANNDQATAIAKTQLAIDNGYPGVWLFRTDMDTMDPATSLLQAIRDTLIDHYKSKTKTVKK